MKTFDLARRTLHGWLRSAQLLEEIRDGIANQSQLLAEKQTALIVGLDSQSRLINDKLKTVIELQTMQLAAHRSQIGLMSEIVEALTTRSLGPHTDYGIGFLNPGQLFNSDR